MSTDVMVWLRQAVHALDNEAQATWATKYVELRFTFFRRYQQGLIFSTVLGAEVFHELLKMLETGEDVEKAVNYTKNINAWLVWARAQPLTFPLTVAEYPDYRNRVTAKTDGTSVHKVNGLLGNVANGVACMERRVWSGDIEGVASAKAAVERAITDIRILTGV